MVKQERKALGRGLRALISPAHVPVEHGSALRKVETEAMDVPQLVEESELSQPVSDSTPVRDSVVTHLTPDTPAVTLLRLSDVFANPDQPRKVFSRDELDDLVESIEQVGVLQPIVVRPKGGGFEIVAGERRWRAAQEAGLENVPAIVKEIDDREAFQISLIENIQRQQLNPIEEARGYQRLIGEFGLTQEQVSEVVGKKRASVANTLRLLNLDDEVLRLVEAEELSQGHAKVILGVKDRTAQRRLAQRIVQEGLSVRAVETLLPNMLVLDSGKAVKQSLEPQKDRTSDVAYPELLDRLRSATGTRVSIRQKNTGRGRIVVEFYSEDELGRLVDLICSTPEFGF
jgi:ParB family chromosome partitioning protein